MTLENTIITGVIFERAMLVGTGVLDPSGADERIQIHHYGRRMIRMQKRGAILQTDSDDAVAKKLKSGVGLMIASWFFAQISDQLLYWLIAALRKRIWTQDTNGDQ